MIESFSFSPDEIETIKKAKKIAEGDGKPFSELIFSLIKQEVIKYESSQPKEQTQLDPFVENPEHELVPFPDIPSAKPKDYKEYYARVDFNHIKGLDQKIRLCLSEYNIAYSESQKLEIFRQNEKRRAARASSKPATNPINPNSEGGISQQ